MKPDIIPVFEIGVPDSSSGGRAIFTMNKKQILITGSTGFIGSYLKNHFNNIYDVISPNRNVLNLTEEKSVSDFFDSNRVDYVIHCALVGRNNLSGINDTILVDNIKMFRNLWNHKNKFDKFINLGTGYEFEIRSNICNAVENALFENLPHSSYGLAKNIIARIISNTPSFYNLRLFGMFHHTELPSRFFQRLKNQNAIHISQDIYFDFVNLEDLGLVIDSVFNNVILERDFNVCYSKKLKLSEHATLFAKVHNIDSNAVTVGQTSNNNFTGDSSILDKYNLPFKGLELGFKKYT